MESMSSTRSSMTLPVAAQETQPLLPSPLPARSFRERFVRLCVSPRTLCLPSKAAVLILVWALVVGAMYTLILDFSLVLGVVGKDFKFNGNKYHFHIFLNVLVPYACVAFVMLLYPLSGYVADVCCGRYKTVIASLMMLICSIGCLAFTCILLMISINKHVPPKLYVAGEYVVIILSVLGFILFIVGLSGFQANFIQLGLEQLLESPSVYLGLFVHWAIWTSSISTPLLLMLFSSYACTLDDGLLYGMLSLPPILFVTLSVIVAFSCKKKHWFYSEPGQHNPYKTVVKVLRFVRKNKYPLRRSAFTYHDNENPTRMDFAKERYGGPFSTEQVEDVKSFLRILAILAALGPVFILEVPSSYFIFASFTLHTGYGPEFHPTHGGNCTARWLLLENGAIGQLFALVAFPVYIWLIYSLLRRCIPRIFVRLFVGCLLLFLGVLSMFATDLLGHLLLNLNDPNIPSYYLHGKASNTSYCMFKIDVTHDRVKSLRLHWGFHIIPNLLVGFSPLLIMSSAFEFISAQSPHSMKGLLVGVFFAIKGMFQLSSAMLLLPFSLPDMWDHGEFVTNPRAVNCDFGYLFTTCGLSLMGLLLFSLMAKRYRYRERDDPPYDQAFVEEVFARTVRRNTYQVHSPDGQNEVQHTVSFPINAALHRT